MRRGRPPKRLSLKLDLAAREVALLDAEAHYRGVSRDELVTEVLSVYARGLEKEREG